MKIFAHDGMIINLETVTSVEKHFNYVATSYKKLYFLTFKFVGKNDPLDTITTSSFSDESIIDGWLKEISETMTKDS